MMSFLAYTAEGSIFVPEKDLTHRRPHGSELVPLRGHAFVEAVTVAGVCLGFAVKEKAKKETNTDPSGNGAKT
jgi:hypothetical protein